MLFSYSSTQSITVQTPAKLNLFLSIDHKRSDGFHDITSLMLSVGIYDTLVFMEEPSSEVKLQVVEANSLLPQQASQNAGIPTGEDNLVVQAIRLLQTKTGTRQGIRIQLTKRIPSEAGLGGGQAMLLQLCLLPINFGNWDCRSTNYKSWRRNWEVMCLSF